MTKSESIAELAKALAKAQGQFNNAERDGSNPTFHKSYATLAGVWDVSREGLSKNGLAIIQLPTSSDGKVIVETILTHESGEWMSEKLEMTPGHSWNGDEFRIDRSPHGIGSAISYARRYSMAAMIGITQADDDGNAASGRDKPDPRQQRREQAAETARQQPPAEIPPAQSNAPDSPPVALGEDWWKRVVCHVGKPGGDMIDKPVGELKRECLEWLAKNVKAKTVKGTNLLNAVKAALAAMPKEESPAEDNLDLTPSPAKEEAPPADTAKPWREVVTHSIGAILGGKKLGDLADAKEGQFKTSTPMGGPAILRRLASEAGIAMITNECKNEGKRDELIAAIRAAVADTKPYDQPEWLAGLDEGGLREEVLRRIAELSVTPETADKTLEESGLQTVAKSSEAELRHVIANWSTVAVALKGGE